jgi:hypothetical protein
MFAMYLCMYIFININKEIRVDIFFTVDINFKNLDFNQYNVLHINHIN